MKGFFNIKRLWQKIGTSLINNHYYLWWICLAIAIVCIVFLFDNINLFHIDFGWHIASSTMFERYGFHGRNPDRFSGLINNLFYPPLEDSIVWIIHNITSLDHMYSFLWYTALIILSYRIGVYMIIRTTKNKLFALFMMIWLSLFFFLDKTDNISYFQGWGFMDLVFTWLTSQSLWISLFLFFIAEYLRPKPRHYILWIFAILIFLSHLVVWPVAFLLRGLLMLQQFTRQNISLFLLSIGITSFFRLPFISYKSLWSSSFIVRDLPVILLMISVIGAIISYYKKATASFWLFLASSVIIFPNYLSIRREAVTWYSYPLPIFHYYRFASISLLCCIIWIVAIRDHIIHLYNKNKIILLSWISFVIACLIMIIQHFWLLNLQYFSNFIGNRDEQFTDYHKIERLYPYINNNKKIFTIDMNRPIDFWLDSFFQYTTPWLPFVKWLFWESYKWNQLQSSYIASLLAPQDIVLDFHYTNTWKQPEYNRLWDGFISHYDIWRLLMAPKDSLRYLHPDRQTLLKNTISSGTIQYKFNEYDTIVIQWVPYILYQISTNSGYSSSSFITLLSSQSIIVSIDTTKQHFSEDILNIIKKESPTKTTPDLIFFDKKNIPDYTLPIWSRYPAYTQDWSSYSIDLWDTPTSIAIRIPNLPWRTIEWENNQSIQVSHGIYDKIISWTGKVIISYHRTRIMIMSYILSLLSFFGFIYCIYKYKK